jgi:hypothetical protein
MGIVASASGESGVSWRRLSSSVSAATACSSSLLILARASSSRACSFILLAAFAQLGIRLQQDGDPVRILQQVGLYQVSQNSVRRAPTRSLMLCSGCSNIKRRQRVASYNQEFNERSINANPRGNCPVLFSRSMNSTVLIEAPLYPGRYRCQPILPVYSLPTLQLYLHFLLQYRADPVEKNIWRVPVSRPRPTRSSPRPDSISAFRRGDPGCRSEYVPEYSIQG